MGAAGSTHISSLDRGALALPALAALASLAALLAAELTRIDGAAVMLASAALVAALARVGWVVATTTAILSRSRHDAMTDTLTGLRNRRGLVEDLSEELRVATPERPRVLMLFDLDEFKRYNDAFGHPAGDALLSRAGKRLEAAVRPYGRAYRLGGDEFCALVARREPGVKAITAAAAAAISDDGEAFDVRASCGVAVLPVEADTPERALQLADQRLYREKARGNGHENAEETRDVLIQVLRERAAVLRSDLDDAAALARAIGRRLDLLPDELDVVVRAAELQDIGKLAIPEAVLGKPGPLDDTEWSFVREHTVVGERILGAASALQPVAQIVRSSHERWDGAGYPDGLAGERIPLGARIVAVCDAFTAMTSPRAYGRARTVDEALAEIQTCAGSQFDPGVVAAFTGVVEAGLAEGERPSSEREAPALAWSVPEEDHHTA